MEIRWFREVYTAPVCLYHFGQYNFQKQIPSYKGRAELFPDEFRKGNLSLRLKDVRGSDDGRYNCMVHYADSYEEALIDVVVRGRPSMSLHSEGGQTRLEFRSEGWYPKPAVIWTDRDGHDVTSLSNTTEQRDSEGRLSLRSSIPVRQESNVFSCLIRSAVSEPNWEPQLHIPRDFFPDPSGWMVSLFLMAALTVAAAALLLIQWRRMDTSTEVAKGHSERQSESEGEVQLDPTDRIAVVSQHFTEIWAPSPACIGTGLQTDSRTRHDFSCYDLIAPPSTVSEELSVSSCGLMLLFCSPGDFFPDPSGWMVSLFTLCPRMLGVCVDIEERRVSFYTVESRAHIYTFTDMRFPEGHKIYPFFCTWDRNRDLVILPPVETETGH
ncbi:BT1A1 protein, partial [Amia calva]|nr:BT1A1 protein [Amia calva]